MSWPKLPRMPWQQPDGHEPDGEGDATFAIDTGEVTPVQPDDYEPGDLARVADDIADGRFDGEIEAEE